MERFDLDAVVSCRDRLSTERDLTRYTTTEAVRDSDAVTPPPWGEKLVATLDRARLLVIEGMGHMVDGTSDPTCPDRIAAAFAASPDPSRLDVSCLAEMTPPSFEITPFPRPEGVS